MSDADINGASLSDPGRPHLAYRAVAAPPSPYP